MQTVMPKDVTMSKNKAKMASEMSIPDYEKKEKRVTCDIVVEQRIVDGQPKMFYCFRNLGMYAPKEEYTSKEEFKRLVNEKIDYIAGELG